MCRMAWCPLYLELVGHFLFDLVGVLGVCAGETLVLLLHHRPLLHHLHIATEGSVLDTSACTAACPSRGLSRVPSVVTLTTLTVYRFHCGHLKCQEKFSGQSLVVRTIRLFKILIEKCVFWRPIMQEGIRFLWWSVKTHLPSWAQFPVSVAK